MNEESNPLMWQSLRMVERAEQKGDFLRAAQICNEARFYERAINNALKAGHFGDEYALQIAMEHLKERVNEVYQQTLNNCRSDEGKRKLAQIVGRKEEEKKAKLTLMEKAEKMANRGNCSEAAKLYETLGQKRKAAELYVKGTVNEKGRRINVWQLIDAAKIYSELGEYSRAAELHEEHGGFPEKAEEFYLRAGDTEKARSFAEKRSHYQLKQVLEGNESALIWLVKDILQYNHRSPIASEHMIEAINKTRDKQPIVNLFPATGSNDRNTTGVLEEICKDEVSKKKLMKIATSGTEFRIETRDLPGTDNFGCSDTEESTYLDLELKEIDPEAIMTAGLYLVATDSRNLIPFQTEHMVDNLHNIIRYRNTERRRVY